jgi:hypothetical protein
MDNWLEEKDSMDLLRRLFPEGVGGGEVMRRLCPEGWRHSTLRLAFHPGPERLWEEHCRFQENLNRLRRSDVPPDPPPDREAFFRELDAKPDRSPEPDNVELGRLVGLCLWDVLSDNHDLICPDGRIRHMGSFRMVGGILSDFIDGAPERSDPDVDFMDWMNWDMGYMDYYMGTAWVSGRTDLTAVYRLIFERLKQQGYGWRYAFPRMQVFRFGKPDSEEQDSVSYDPSASFAREQERVEKDAEFDRLQAELEQLHQDALEEAKVRPPPSTVSAFRDVYGRWPEGWPPW